MKKFLIASLILLLVALLISIAAFFYVSAQLQKSQLLLQPNTVETVATINANENESNEKPPESLEGIPLRDLSLNDSQRSVLETVGVDIETFVITPAMQECAETKLGTMQMQEIIAGDAPTTMETIKLLPCLSVD